MRRELTVIDIYCGAGGFSEGFNKAGFKILKGYDIWERGRKTFEYNQNGAGTVGGDIIELSKLPDKEFHSVFPDQHFV